MRFGRLSTTKELYGIIQKPEGTGRSVKYVVYFSEVEVTKAFSLRSLKRQATATNEANSNSDAHVPPSISAVEPASPGLTCIAQQHERDLEVDTTLSANVLELNGRSLMVSLKTGGVCLNSEDTLCGTMTWMRDRWTPLDYWMMSFPSQMLPDISIWTSDHMPQGCVNAKEEEVLAVFGALYL